MTDNLGQPPRPWDKREGENMRWWSRFDQYYRAAGPERSLLGAYRAWKEDDRHRKGAKDRKGQNPRNAPTSWRNEAVESQWAARALAWDTFQAEQRRIAEREEMEKSHKQRIALLNAAFGKSLTALNSSQTAGLRLGEAVNAVRMVVQELRQEYKLFGTEAEQPAQAASPESGMFEGMSDEQLTAAINNLFVASQLVNKETDSG